MFDKNIGGQIVRVFKIIVVGGLCLSLAFNGVMFSKINNIENRMNTLSNYQHQMINAFNAQIGQISSTVNQIKEDQRWVSAVSVKTEMNDADKKEIRMIFEWQVKELQNNSEVFFNYKRTEEEGYHSIKAEDLRNGFFRVVMPIEATLEPVWNAYILDRGSRSTNEPIRVIEGRIESKERVNQVSLDYFVSVDHGDLMKSSEVNTVHIEDMGARYYGYIEVTTDIDRNNHYSLSVINVKASNTSSYLNEVHVKKYRDGQLIEKEELEKTSVMYEGDTPAREDTTEFYKSASEEFNYDRLVLKAIFSDGSTFESEIYHE